MHKALFTDSLFVSSLFSVIREASFSLFHQIACGYLCAQKPMILWPFPNRREIQMVDSTCLYIVNTFSTEIISSVHRITFSSIPRLPFCLLFRKHEELCLLFHRPFSSVPLSFLCLSTVCTALLLFLFFPYRIKDKEEPVFSNCRAKAIPLQ